MGCCNTFLFGVLLLVILACKAWPQRPDEDDYRSYSELNRHHKRDSTVKTSTPRGKQDIRIVFPTEQPKDHAAESDRNDFSAEGKGVNCTENVCEDALDYPEDYIKELLKKVPLYNRFFGAWDGAIVNQGSRLGEGDEDREKSLCETTTLTKYPRTLTNLGNITKYIINFDVYRQGVVFETCTKKAHCGEASFPAGYSARCVQRYSTVRLVAVEHEKGMDPSLDSFVIPSCCVCSILKTKN